MTVRGCKVSLTNELEKALLQYVFYWGCFAGPAPLGSGDQRIMHKPDRQLLFYAVH